MKLNDIITDYTQDPRSIQSAVAVKMVKEGVDRSVIQRIYNVSAPFISKWWRVYLDNEGDASSLLISYKGSSSFLTAEKKEKVAKYIQAQPNCKLPDLKLHVKEVYGVSFKSDQSYYDLFKQAGYSWKKSQKKELSKMKWSPNVGSNT